MVMPGMGGNELAQEYIALDPGIRIVFTSGYTDQSAVQRWIDRGYRFLQKPYTHAELLHIVREALDRK